MKIFFRLSLMLALSLMMLSCSKEEDVTVNSKSSSFQAKNNGLTTTQVNALKAECLKFSTSQSFLLMRAKSDEFATKLHNPNADLSSREKLEIWLSNNLSTTYFKKKQDALDIYDDLVSKAGIFIAANTTFINSLSGATNEQLHIILGPILLDPPVTQVNSACENACNERFDYQMGRYDFNYIIAFEEGGDNAGYMAEFEYIYASFVKEEVDILNSCLGACNDE